MSVLRDPIPSKYGTIHGANDEFVIEGDLEAAYAVLKQMFEPKKMKNRSGPIKPMTVEEIRNQENRHISDTLEQI